MRIKIPRDKTDSNLIEKESWVIAIPPVNDALPGDKIGFGCPLADQLSFGCLILMLRGIPNSFEKIFKF